MLVSPESILGPPPLNILDIPESILGPPEVKVLDIPLNTCLNILLRLPNIAAMLRNCLPTIVFLPPKILENLFTRFIPFTFLGLRFLVRESTIFPAPP